MCFIFISSHIDSSTVVSAILFHNWVLAFSRRSPNFSRSNFKFSAHLLGFFKIKCFGANLGLLVVFESSQHSHYQYWRKRGVPGPKPTYFVGNLGPSFRMKKSLADIYAEIYHQFPDAPLVGIFRASTPTLLIRDPELIKDITVKSFQHFHDNDLFIDKNVDPISGKNPFFLRGEEWRKTRAILTPAFTSGKMKLIYPLLEDVSKRFVDYLENHPTATKGGGCDAKQICYRFTLTNVGICAFGVDARCFEEENLDFKQIADRFFSPEWFHSVKLFLISIIPALTKLVSIKFTPADVEEKITRIVSETLRYREENNIVRNDFLHIIKSTTGFELDDIVAQAAGFFADGYESSSVFMQFYMYEIAANPKIQTRLREEINKVFERNNSLPYEDIQTLPYLDACTNEALRLHIPGRFLGKTCTKAYTYASNDNKTMKKPLEIEPGTPIILPVWALQNDPQYFENPTVFNPERFLPPNKENITKFTFLPFGEGPRSCLGQRFGLLQIKIGIAYLVRNFELSVNPRTQLPLKLDPVHLFPLPIGGLWIDFKKLA